LLGGTIHVCREGAAWQALIKNTGAVGDRTMHYRPSAMG
jgi:hypothetical protein